MHVEESLVLLHPDLDGAGCVDPVGVLVAGEGVGVEGAEDVADLGVEGCQVVLQVAGGEREEKE